MNTKTFLLATLTGLALIALTATAAWTAKDIINPPPDCICDTAIDFPVFKKGIKYDLICSDIEINGWEPIDGST